MKNKAHKIGTLFFVLWGILHILAGTRNLYLLASTDATIPLDFPWDALGIIRQHNMNIVLAGIFAIAIGLLMNWRNSRSGFWLNLFIVGGFDLAFILSRALPGSSQPVDWLGPILAALAIVFTAAGRFRGGKTTT